MLRELRLCSKLLPGVIYVLCYMFSHTGVIDKIFHPRFNPFCDHSWVRCNGDLASYLFHCEHGSCFEGWYWDIEDALVVAYLLFGLGKPVKSSDKVQLFKIACSSFSTERRLSSYKPFPSIIQRKHLSDRVWCFTWSVQQHCRRQLDLAARRQVWKALELLDLRRSMHERVARRVLHSWLTEHLARH